MVRRPSTSRLIGGQLELPAPLQGGWFFAGMASMRPPPTAREQGPEGFNPFRRQNLFSKAIYAQAFGEAEASNRCVRLAWNCTEEDASEQDLVVALEKIFVMSRRGDDRLDMPDLFRVAAKLLKKGAPAPLLRPGFRCR